MFSLWTYIGIAVAIFAAGSGAGYEGKAFLDSREIAQEQLATAKAKENAQDIQMVLDTYHVQVEKDRADANAQALAQQTALEGTIASLKADAAAKEKQRQVLSLALTKALKDAPKSDSRALGPTVLAYLAKLRDNAAAPSSSSAPGNQNPKPVPGGTR